MAPKNKYVGRAKLSQRNFLQLVRLFAAGMEATRIADELGVSRNTVNTYMRRIRERIAEESCASSFEHHFYVEGAPGVFFVIRTARNSPRSRKTGRAFLHGRIHGDNHLSIEVNKGREADVLHTLLGGNLRIEGQVFNDSWSVFSDLMDGGLPRDHTGCHTPDARAAVALLESFLENTRLRLEKFRGIKRELVRLHIKESEFRFNNRENIEKALLKMLKGRPL